MKTPMQEYIEWLKSENKKYTEKAQEESSMQILGYAFKMRDCIKHAESMLEKEKEMLAGVWLDAQVAYQGDEYIKPSDPTFDEYYEETFNTK